MLNENTKAIEFSLPDKDGKMISLSSFRGKKVILYFYPKDNTPGCTKQALSYKEKFEEFIDKNTVIIGVSKDSVSSHKKFVEKYELPFILLSDTTVEVIKAYDVWKEKKFMGKRYMGVVRSTYLIDESGMIIHAFENVSPDKDAQNMSCLI